jgi:hypothetical protein
MLEASTETMIKENEDKKNKTQEDNNATRQSE